MIYIYIYIYMQCLLCVQTSGEWKSCVSFHRGSSDGTVHIVTVFLEIKPADIWLHLEHQTSQWQGFYRVHISAFILFRKGCNTKRLIYFATFLVTDFAGIKVVCARN
jgi:hypothetical protein